MFPQTGIFLFIFSTGVKLSDEATGRRMEALMGLDLEQQVSWPWNQLQNQTGTALLSFVETLNNKLGERRRIHLENWVQTSV